MAVEREKVDHILSTEKEKSAAVAPRTFSIFYR